MLQVDLLKDQVEEVEEQSSLILKELRAKSHDYELLKRDHAESRRAVQLLQSALDQQQSMLAERGLVLLGANGDGEDEEEVVEDEEQDRRTRAIVSQETATILSALGEWVGTGVYGQLDPDSLIDTESGSHMKKNNIFDFR